MPARCLWLLAEIEYLMIAASPVNEGFRRKVQALKVYDAAFFAP
jgi:hypothetical protein